MLVGRYKTLVYRNYLYQNNIFKVCGVIVMTRNGLDKVQILVKVLGILFCTNALEREKNEYTSSFSAIGK